VTDEDSLKSALQEVTADLGEINGLVNNAGIHKDGPSDRFQTAGFEAVMRTNVYATFAACREVFPFLTKAGGGLIVTIGSFYDRAGVPGNAAYCASKAAVGAIARSLAVEWARNGIRVLNIAPGFVETDLNRKFRARESFQTYLRSRIPVGRASSPKEVAQLVGALFTEDLNFLTGETIYFDGGQSVAL
jgi:NAD(P)-dependent dehydrogenase (short-subunit alcohol dehydrogenase family)